eukprot:scaffold3141_cov53-Attheya_sp.AAC.1
MASDSPSPDSLLDSTTRDEARLGTQNANRADGALAEPPAAEKLLAGTTDKAIANAIELPITSFMIKYAVAFLFSEYYGLDDWLFVDCDANDVNVVTLSRVRILFVEDLIRIPPPPLSSLLTCQTRLTDIRFFS